MAAPNSLDVHEVFTSLQGESTLAGQPAFFVRLSGCNLDCPWCDTPGAREHRGSAMTVDLIVEKALAAGTPQVCVTGGEPLLQDATPVLLAKLTGSVGTTVLMTNGSLPMDRVPPEVIKVVDVKTPWAMEEPPEETGGTYPETPYVHGANIGLLRPSDEVKFVVRNRAEFDWACAWATSKRLFDRLGAVLVGPEWGGIDAAVLWDWVVASGLPLRLNLQWHKIVLGADTKL